MNLPLPSDSRLALKYKNTILKTDNLGLLFNKYVYSWEKDWQMKEEDTRKFREDVSKSSFNNAKKYVLATYNRQKATLKSLKSSGYYVEPFEMTTDSRLIIGLGGTSVIETGITLHPLYGFPYLPASGLKGLARAYAEIGDDATKEELLDIFGSEDKDPRHAINNRQGKVFFLDGLPTIFPQLDLDIMNPHYGKYYQGKNPPADYLKPLPITFLAVAAGETFSFAIFSQQDELLKKARQWLIGGLTELGAGGKTNVGYGYFKEVESPSVQKSSSLSVDSQSIEKTEYITWKNANLSWTPGNQTLTGSKDNKKAELKLVNDKSFVPEKFHKQLFEKKKSIKVNLIVEPFGNSFKIIKIENNVPE